MSQSLAFETKRGGEALWARLARHVFPHVSLWLLTLAMLAANILILVLNPRITVDPAYPLITEILYGFAALLMLAHWARPQLFDWFLQRVWAALMSLTLMLAFTSNLAVLHYLVMTQHWPYADSWLIAADRALGFDWLAYGKFMTGSETSTHYLHFFYHEVTRKGMFMLPLVAVLLNQRVRAYETLFMIIVTGVVVVLAAGFFPAIEPWTLLADQELMSRISWSARINHVEAMEYLRSEGPILIDLSKLVGLATFPSYHTCLALCFFIALRGYPVLNVVGALCSVSILAATPIFGAHYLMDLLAGGAITAATFFAWKRFVLPAVGPRLEAMGEPFHDFPKAIMNLRFGKAAAKRQA